MAASKMPQSPYIAIIRRQEDASPWRSRPVAENAPRLAGRSQPLLPVPVKVLRAYMARCYCSKATLGAPCGVMDKAPGDEATGKALMDNMLGSGREISPRQHLPVGRPGASLYASTS